MWITSVDIEETIQYPDKQPEYVFQSVTKYLLQGGY